MSISFTMNMNKLTIGWHDWLDGHELEQAQEVGDGQGSLACCSPWSCKESDMTEQLNWRCCWAAVGTVLSSWGQEEEHGPSPKSHKVTYTWTISCKQCDPCHMRRLQGMRIHRAESCLIFSSQIMHGLLPLSASSVLNMLDSYIFICILCVMTWIINLYPCIMKWVLLTKLCVPDLGAPTHRADQRHRWREQTGGHSVGRRRWDKSRK